MAQQNVRWACKILETNETHSGKVNAPEKVLGVPEVYPAYGAQTNPNSWIVGGNNKGYKSDHITLKVGFCDPIIAEQIVIIESYNPGSISSVTIFEKSGKATKVYSVKPQGISEKGRVLSIPIKATSSPVVALLITASNTHSTGWNYIDAIGVASTKAPIDLKINLNPDATLIGNSEPLSDAINSSSLETYPIISSDGNILYFARVGDKDNIDDPTTTDIWYSTKLPNGNWAKAQNIGKPLNNSAHNFVSSITPDVNTLLIANTYKADGSTAGNGVSISEYTMNGWEVPKRLIIEGFVNLNEFSFVSYFLAADGKTMLMCTEMPDSYGDLDIYVSFIKADKTWTRPLNIGKTINTFQADATPYLASDGKTLYFASQGHLGYGSYDIFMTKRLDDTWLNWTTPVNLGPKVNTMYADLSFSIPASGDVAYTYALRDKTNLMDIYSIALAPSIKPEPVTMVIGRVLDAKTEKPIGAKIEYDILASGMNIGIAHSNAVTGSYQIVLPGGNTYAYRAQVPGYFSVNKNIKIETNSLYNEIHVDLLLVPIETGQKIELNNVFFYQSAAKLIETSYPELDRIVEELKNNPAVTIELDGHTDNQGDPALNIALSQSRVEAVKAYFVQKGIDAKRITTKAFGGSKPIAPNDTEENRKKNRRVEIVIISDH
ncbi:OmpA family protein [Cytophaga aurantiaca]|uniref:OmpA family protein n=1 Tax=Cytophaga aurantiaca TaxID=29530 RepID=UPI000363B97D|nr:OmpA family protein [Cytophaga aurantiaca]